MREINHVVWNKLAHKTYTPLRIDRSNSTLHLPRGVGEGQGEQVA